MTQQQITKERRFSLMFLIFSQMDASERLTNNVATKNGTYSLSMKNGYKIANLNCF